MPPSCVSAILLYTVKEALTPAPSIFSMERGSPYSDSPLLSEIHALFPALLYDPARFRSLQDVFRYVREQLRARYDIFSNATRDFQNNDPVFVNRTNTVVTSRIPVVSMNVMESINQIAISDLIRSFLQGGTGTNTDAYTAPNPTSAQIESATQRLSYVGPDTECAICQDSIVTNEVVRRVNTCQHMYHDACLITWFERHATCPLCRNDIRAEDTVIPPPLP